MMFFYTHCNSVSILGKCEDQELFYGNGSSAVAIIFYIIYFFSIPFRIHQLYFILFRFFLSYLVLPLHRFYLLYHMQI